MSRWQVLSLDRVRLTAAPAVDFDFRHGPRSVCTTHCPRGRGRRAPWRCASRVDCCSRWRFSRRLGDAPAGACFVARRSSTTCSRMIRPPRPFFAPKRVRAGDRDAGRQRRSHPGRRRGRVHVRPTHGGEPRERPRLLPRRGRRRALSRLEAFSVRARVRGSGHVQSGARQVRLPPGHGRRRVRARPTRTLRSPRDPPPRPAAVLQRLLRSRRVRRRFLPMPPGFSVPTAPSTSRTSACPTRPGHPLARSPPTPKVYVCHMPPRFNQHFDTRKLDRPIEILFERVSSSHHRTGGSDDADLFLVHVTPRLIAGHGGKALYLDAIKYVNETWPERTRRAAGATTCSSSPIGDRAIFPQQRGPGARRVAGRARQRHRVVALGSREAQEGVSRRWSLLYPEKDVLLPPIQSSNAVDLYSPFSPFALASPPGNESTEMWTSKKRNPATTPGATDGGGALAIDGKPQNVDGPVVETTHALVNVVNPVRRWLLYFAGTTVKPSDGYAVRRLLMDALGGREAEGIRLVERDEHYVENLAASTFCLAPTGTGWGRRVGLAAQFGCIPSSSRIPCARRLTTSFRTTPSPFDSKSPTFPTSRTSSEPSRSRARGSRRRAVPPSACARSSRARFAR